jgi:hypothetical protein
MNLLTSKLSESLPKLCSQKILSNEKKTVYAKFFLPIGNWTWFVMEGEKKKEDFLFFGFIVGFNERFDYFTLSELETIETGGLKVERDLYFQPGEFKNVIGKFRKDREL